MAEKLTDQQKAVVDDRGGKLLVSAAAGSGKTKVLVDRLLKYLTDPVAPANLDDFLIITYTRAAAAELRGRIAQELSARIAENPNDRHLQRQLLLVYQADIKTIDSFCTGLLRENVHLLELEGERGLTADFRVLDESEAMLLRRRVLPRVLEEFYGNLTPGGAALAESPYDQAYKNITVVISVDGYASKPIICYRMKGDGVENLKVGDTYQFGTYEQDNDLSNGKETIEWRILDKKGTQILVTSEYVLDCQPYDWGGLDITWEDSSLREWLNLHFIAHRFHIKHSCQNFAIIYNN